MQRVSLIYAADESNAIGYKNKLPWNIPGELKHFQEVTAGGVVVMGRKTWEGLPQKPLKDRVNVVISSTEPYGGVMNWAMSLGNAKRFWESRCTLPVFIIGGAKLFEEAAPLANSIYFTRVMGVHKADTFFSLPNFVSLWDRKVLERTDLYERFLYTKKELIL